MHGCQSGLIAGHCCVCGGWVAEVLDQGQGSIGVLFAFQTTTQQVGLVDMAFSQGLWAFDGWSNINRMTEELKNPRVNA